MNENNIVKNGRFLCECSKCKHKWIKRTVENPKMCPKCKSYKWLKEIKDRDWEAF